MRLSTATLFTATVLILFSPQGYAFGGNVITLDPDVAPGAQQVNLQREIDESLILANTLAALTGTETGRIIIEDGRRIYRVPSRGSAYDYIDKHRYQQRKFHSKSIRSCRVEKYITYKHGHRYIIKKTVCREGGPYEHYRFRHNYYGDDYSGDWRRRQPSSGMGYDWRNKHRSRPR